MTSTPMDARSPLTEHQRAIIDTLGLLGVEQVASNSFGEITYACYLNGVSKQAQQLLYTYVKPITAHRSLDATDNHTVLTFRADTHAVASRLSTWLSNNHGAPNDVTLTAEMLGLLIVCVGVRVDRGTDEPEVQVPVTPLTRHDAEVVHEACGEFDVDASGGVGRSPLMIAGDAVTTLTDDLSSTLAL